MHCGRGRDIVFSAREWGSNQPWLWARNTGNSWRTTSDIYDAWEGKKDYSIGVMNILDANAELYPFAGPGHWDDRTIRIWWKSAMVA
jgi:alpha-galactosidase